MQPGISGVPGRKARFGGEQTHEKTAHRHARPSEAYDPAFVRHLGGKERFPALWSGSPRLCTIAFYLPAGGLCTLSTVQCGVSLWKTLLPNGCGEG